MFETVEACALRCCPPGIRGNEYSAVAQRAAGCNKGPSLIGGFVSTCDAFRRTALPRTTIRPSCRAAGFRCDETAVNSAAQSCRFVAHEDRSITYLVLPSSASAVALHSRFIYHRHMWAARYRSDPVCGPPGFMPRRWICPVVARPARAGKAGCRGRRRRQAVPRRREARRCRSSRGYGLYQHVTSLLKGARARAGRRTARQPVHGGFNRSAPPRRWLMAVFTDSV